MNPGNGREREREKMERAERERERERATKIEHGDIHWKIFGVDKEKIRRN